MWSQRKAFKHGNYTKQITVESFGNCVEKESEERAQRQGELLENSVQVLDEAVD